MNYEKAEDDQENDPVFARMLFKVRWQLFSPLDAGNRIDGQSWQERITYHLSFVNFYSHFRIALPERLVVLEWAALCRNQWANEK